MTAEPEAYLAVLKASYDYEPQSDDEIAIKEDQLLLLKEKVDDDWWKVKIKGSSQEEDYPAGLVPAAYVEQADHISTVKALYDYEAQAPGELTIKEEEILLVFEMEQDWLLVQSRKANGMAGFVPGNYVEAYSEGESISAPPIVVPPSAPRPVSTYVDPAVRVASAKVTADGIKTWSVSEIDKKGKKKKGTLGIGNGAVFFASEADKTPVLKWQTEDLQSATSEKSKHISIDIGGTAPVNLHFHVGSKDNVDAILTKLNASKALSHSSTTPERSISPEVASPRETKKVQVHFSQASPVIIPSRESLDEEDEEQERAVSTANSSKQTTHDQMGDPGIDSGVALYDFTADGNDELSIIEGEQLAILERDGDEWWKCRNSKGKEGVVPASYIEVSNSFSTPSHEPNTSRTPDRGEELSTKEAELQAEAEQLEREKAREQAERAQKKLEAQRRAKDAAAAADAERKRRKEAAAATQVSPPPVSGGNKSAENGVPSNHRRTSTATENNRPPPERTRIWHDRSGQFRVEAAFLGFNNGKLRLHKVNGVIVEVPSEKMSLEDMQYVEKLTTKKPQPKKEVSDDDIPLGITRPGAGPTSNSARTVPPKKKSNIDWFDFFLSAGCDLDDCTRYAASFERDKIDESILPDITDATMRSLGLREGDIIRVTKAIQNRKPTDNLKKPSAYAEEQLRRDEELARQLQAQESGGLSRSTAPNLFAGPGGVLKNPRRGRPQPSKSLPPSNVDLKAISTVSDQILRSSSPQIASPVSAHPPPTSVHPPPRSSSAIPVSSGFDDDAWTNRPNSTKPQIESPPPAAPRAPSAPPVASVSTTPPPAPPQATPTLIPPAQSSAPPLGKTTESDIFDQLARLSELRKQPTPSQQPPTSTSPLSSIPPSYQAGLGMGSSPAPISQHLQNPQLGIPPQPSPQPYNGPRGPFAPVPANQSLLQPLIPTQTGFNSFIPTRPGNAISPFQGQQSQPSFIAQQQTGVPMIQPMISQPTGLPFSGFSSYQSPSTNTPVQNQFTGFNPNLNQPPLNNGMTQPPVPSLPSGSSTSPASIFAQMKSGTFAADNSGTESQPSAKYDALRPNPLVVQATGWSQPYQGGYMGYQH